MIFRSFDRTQLLEEFKDEIKQFRIMETTTARVIEEVKEQHSEIGIIYMNEHNQAGNKDICNKEN